LIFIVGSVLLLLIFVGLVGTESEFMKNWGDVRAHSDGKNKTLCTSVCISKESAIAVGRCAVLECVCARVRARARCADTSGVCENTATRPDVKLHVLSKIFKF
jgi:hypothetical protein